MKYEYPDTIYLQPQCAVDPDLGQQWSDCVPTEFECECGGEHRAGRYAYIGHDGDADLDHTPTGSAQ